MYPTTSTLDLTQYDFTENEAKWKHLFIPGLKRVFLQVGYYIEAKPDALDHLEKLILQLLGLLTSRPSPHSIPEVQERVGRMFPAPIDKWAMDEAGAAVKRGRKAEVVFPVERIHSLLVKDVLQHKVDHSMTVYICAVLEYIAADILHLVGNYVKHSRIGELTTQDIKAAMCCDKVLCDLFKLGDMTSVTSMEVVDRSSVTYNEVVEDLLQSERQYLRDLQMLIKVFREQLANQLEKESQSLELVFSLIVEISDLTIGLISTVEDTVEMTEPGIPPSIGICLLELAENGEFEVYDRYAEAFGPETRLNLEKLLSRPDVEATVSTAGHGFFQAVKFYFPKLLMEPFQHCLTYFQYIKLLYSLSPSESDKTDLLQADSVLTSLKTVIESLGIKHDSTKILGKGNKFVAQQKIKEVQGLVEGFQESLRGSYFNEFFCEGDLLKIGPSKKPSDRRAYLFDGILLLLKPKLKATDYKLKESLVLTKLEVRDREDFDENKNLFEIAPRDQPPIILSTRSPDEKMTWMSILVMLTCKSMLDRILDRFLSDDERKHPLRLPDVSKYRFAVEDCDENIVMEKGVIKGATLLKLVERLTHHQYSDPNFVNTFLTTYRSFCQPHEFLSLLIERFNIPDPELDPEELESVHSREFLKRFRKEYARHVKLRVLNVVKQWVLHHFYDFERDPSLQQELEDFLDRADERGKSCIFESVRRCLRKAADTTSTLDLSISAVKSPPPIETHIKCPPSEWSLLTLHPIELARQLTILEFDYYRVVKPSELVGSVWTKKNKEVSSPNLLRMIKHTTNVTRWFERSIVDAENLEERVAVVSRVLEVMIVLQELHNFNGVLAVVSAMGSASVHRLGFTWQNVSPRLMKALEEAQELQNDHYKRYQERLRSINPPCVPFFGMYLTNILHIEEGNLDYLPSSPDLINFSKRRKVAEITSEIRQFQYSHYVLAVEPKLREFIEKLQPFDPEVGENEISNYLYEKSLEIEPRGGRGPAKLPRRWPDLPLKSPGIKPKHLPGRSHPAPLLPFSSSTLTLHSSPSRLTLESDLDTTINMENGTPKTLTPSSNPSLTSPGGSEFSVFAPVLIGSISPAMVQPPPLPPRRSSPRVEVPPPLPPRKVSPRTPMTPKGPPVVPRRESPGMSPAVSNGPGFFSGLGPSETRSAFEFSNIRVRPNMEALPPKLPPKPINPDPTL